MKKLILVDGYGFVFRAYHSLPPLTRKSDGTPIGAVFGFASMLLKLVLSHQSDAIAVVLDSGEKNFRHEIYPAYKANRPTPPDDLIVQFPLIRQAVDAFGITTLEKSGFEADDLIATYTKHALKKGYEVIIVSSDKDLTQLMRKGVAIYDGMKEKYITDEDIIKKFGVPHTKIREVMALIGDSSDNIPGVKGIGVKTASELIAQFGDLTGVYHNIDAIPQARRKEMLLAGKDNAFLSYELVALKNDVPLDYEISELELQQIDFNKLGAYLNEEGFKSLHARIASFVTNAPIAKEITYQPLQTKSDIEKLVPQIYKSGHLFFHIENDLNVTFTFGDKYYIYTTTKTQPQGSLFDDSSTPKLDDFFSALESVMLSSAVLKVVHDAKAVYKRNTKFQSIVDIIMLAYSNITSRSAKDLKSLLEQYSIDYENSDAHAVRCLYEELSQKLMHNRHVALYNRIDKDIPYILARMEEKGVLLDMPYLAGLTTHFQSKIKEIENQVYNLSGSDFNIASPLQMGEVLFEKLKIPYQGKKNKRGYSTSAEILEELYDQGYEICGHILEWRQYSKLVNTYTDALPKAINKQTGRVHTNFSATSTATGRFSSSEPNLQNIPIRTEEGQKIRKAFIAQKGHKLISADYSQIELRLLAHYANIASLKEAFKNGLDIHAATASDMFDLPLDKITSDLRRKAKTINFGIIYGISAFGLAKRLDIPRDQAKYFIDHYFKKYPGIHEYMQNTIEYARKHGYVMTVFGRRCMVEGLNDKNFQKRSFAERAAINAPLQASAADIIKKAMCSLDDDLLKCLTLQIHDELLFEVPLEKVEEYIKTVKTTMQNVIQLSIPLVVEVSSGDNWGEAH